jgi:hypothetical protein
MVTNEAAKTTGANMQEARKGSDLVTHGLPSDGVHVSRRPAKMRASTKDPSTAWMANACAGGRASSAQHNRRDGRRATVIHDCPHRRPGEREMVAAKEQTRTRRQRKRSERVANEEIRHDSTRTFVCRGSDLDLGRLGTCNLGLGFLGDTWGYLGVGEHEGDPRWAGG